MAGITVKGGVDRYAESKGFYVLTPSGHAMKLPAASSEVSPAKFSEAISPPSPRLRRVFSSPLLPAAGSGMSWRRRMKFANSKGFKPKVWNA